MPVKTHKYSNGVVTVVWKPDTCIHSRICWAGLNEVFNPSLRPWINMDGATTEQIIDQVRKCPSGALSYFLNENSVSDGEIEIPAVT
ncbi:MAG TPA: (4Fe-4S)-binding protein [Panacibacter sp.]|nr:(4Fe-4S)-binding protein [Panacibacter sp.]